MPAPILAKLLDTTNSKPVTWARPTARNWRTGPAAGPEMRRRYDDGRARAGDTVP